jgi:hypothetical protein
MCKVLSAVDSDAVVETGRDRRAAIVKPRGVSGPSRQTLEKRSTLARTPHGISEGTPVSRALVTHSRS